VSKGTGFRGLVSAATLLFAGAAAAAYTVTDRQGETPFLTLKKRYSEITRGDTEKVDMVSDYLKKEAKSNQDVSDFLRNKEQDSQNKKANVFRLDVSKEGLKKTFTFLLETKRMEEATLINQVRSRRAPRGYEGTLRSLKQEKKELKNILKRLNKRKL